MTEYSPEVPALEVIDAAAPDPANLTEKSATAAPDPVKVAALGAALKDLAAHVDARAAQNAEVGAEFKEVAGILKSLVKRFEEEGLGASQVGHVSDSEARLVEGLIRRATDGRDHLEMSYLRQLADSVSLAALSLAR